MLEWCFARAVVYIGIVKTAYKPFICVLRHFVCFAEGVLKNRKNAKNSVKICTYQKKAVILHRYVRCKNSYAIALVKIKDLRS